MHQNIAGLINKADQLTLHLQELAEQGSSIDIICVTEHFMEQGYEKFLSIPNYKLAACYSRNIKRGGSCILIRLGLSFRELIDISKLSIQGVIECCGIELTQHNLVIISLYRVPKHNLNIFYERLNIIFSKLCYNSKKKMIICGDFNVDLLKQDKISLEFTTFFF